jgi:trimethylamine:corrinoid methyltransferase-like protein
LIAQVGAHGQYLKTEHTRKHFRDYWYPDLFERGNYSDWVQKGSQTLVERAAARVQKILAEHQVEPLPAAIQARLAEIVNRAVNRKS